MINMMEVLNLRGNDGDVATAAAADGLHDDIGGTACLRPEHGFDQSRAEETRQRRRSPPRTPLAQYPLFQLYSLVVIPGKL